MEEANSTGTAVLRYFMLYVCNCQFHHQGTFCAEFACLLYRREWIYVWKCIFLKPETVVKASWHEWKDAMPAMLTRIMCYCQTWLNTISLQLSPFSSIPVEGDNTETAVTVNCSLMSLALIQNTSGNQSDWWHSYVFFFKVFVLGLILPIILKLLLYSYYIIILHYTVILLLLYMYMYM